MRRCYPRPVSVPHITKHDSKDATSFFSFALSSSALWKRKTRSQFRTSCSKCLRLQEAATSSLNFFACPLPWYRQSHHSWQHPRKRPTSVGISGPRPGLPPSLSHPPAASRASQCHPRSFPQPVRPEACVSTGHRISDVARASVRTEHLISYYVKSSLSMAYRTRRTPSASQSRTSHIQRVAR